MNFMRQYYHTTVINFMPPYWFDGEEKTRSKGKPHRLNILPSINVQILLELVIYLHLLSLIFMILS